MGVKLIVFPGLSIMAGRLLLNAPEEDAFWTFVSIMDANLRGYFSSKTNQMEVDATILGKALESLDENLALSLKWPNDVLIEGQKVAGILIVSRSTATELVVQVGIGINIADPDEGDNPSVGAF